MALGTKSDSSPYTFLPLIPLFFNKLKKEIEIQKLTDCMDDVITIISHLDRLYAPAEGRIRLTVTDVIRRLMAAKPAPSPI